MAMNHHWLEQRARDLQAQRLAEAAHERLVASVRAQQSATGQGSWLVLLASAWTRRGMRRAARRAVRLVRARAGAI